MNISLHQKWFENFAAAKIASCPRETEPLQLKLEHTRNVFDNARRIVSSENFPPELAQICLLAALYHDVARFDQYIEYGTFKDAVSRDHGNYGVKILKREKRLVDLDDKTRRLVLLAVCLHNKFKLPADLTKDQKIACYVTRDADKLDILRVMDQHLSHKPYNPTVVLSLADDAHKYSAAVINAVLEGRIASYSDLTSVNDFRLLLGSWFLDLNFKSSKHIFLEAGHITRILEPLADNPNYRNAYNCLLSRFASDL